MLKKLLSTAAAICVAGATWASSLGFDPMNVANFDILPGWRTESGTHMTALRIQLAPGWKTYWRAPGEAGIPPRFDWTGSENLGAVAFHWPTPQVFHQNGMRAVGYENELVLPMELTPDRNGRPIALRADIELGVCQDVCMPIQVRVSADLTDGAPDPRISGAIRNRPDTAREAGMRKVSCAVEPITDGLRLTADIDMPSLGPGEMAVFELPDQLIWIAEAQAERRGGVLRAVTDLVPPSNQPFALDRSQVRITVLGSGRAVDIWGCSRS